MENGSGRRYRNIETHFEGPYRKHRAEHSMNGKLPRPEVRKQLGADLFRKAVLRRAHTRTLRDLAYAAEVLKKENVVMSAEFGRELIPQMDDFEIDCGEGYLRFEVKEDSLKLMYRSY